MGRHIKNGVPYGGTVNNSTMVKHGDSTVANEIDGLKTVETLNVTIENNVFKAYGYKCGKVVQVIVDNINIATSQTEAKVLGNLPIPKVDSSNWGAWFVSTNGDIKLGQVNKNGELTAFQLNPNTSYWANITYIAQ